MSASPMPAPESAMRTAICPAGCSRTEISSRLPPPGVDMDMASRALRTRLMSACRSCASSAATSGSPAATSTDTATPSCASSPRAISTTDVTMAPRLSRSSFGRGRRAKRR